MAPAHAGTLSMISEQRWVSVARVYDGDTFETRRGEKVRLLGINTPEIAHGDSPAEPWGEKAASALKHLIEGQRLRLSFDTEKRDRYGRLLAQVWLRDGRWVNGLMVREGYAHVYTFVPNLRWSKALHAEELQARRARRGIWSHDRFEVLTAKDVSRRHIGEFRVVHGTVKSLDRHGWRFKLAKLNISVPRKYRQWYKKGLRLRSGQVVTVRGKIRISSAGRLFLALHAPTDLEVEEP
jgi:endonuclease YncB( thermonuclease family)